MIVQYANHVIIFLQEFVCLAFVLELESFKMITQKFQSSDLAVGTVENISALFSDCCDVWPISYVLSTELEYEYE